MAEAGYGHTVVRTPGGSEYVVLVFTVNGVGPAATVSEDLDGVTESIATNGAGDYTVTLAENWYRIHPLACNVEAAGGEFAGNIGAVTEGASANTVQVLTYDTSAGALDHSSSSITVALMCRRNDA